MPIIPLNDRKVASLATPAVRAEYFDQTFPSFGLRVTPSGIKTFFVMYRTAGRLRRMSLGRYPRVKLARARAAARDALHQVSLGLDPLAERDAAAERTFGALATLYIDKYAKPRKRSWRDDDRMIRRELDAWTHRPVEAIARREVREVLERIVDRGAPIAANRVLALIRKMFNFALDREWIAVNPAARMQAPSKEHSRDRVLSDEEIRVVWDFLRSEPPMTRTIHAKRRTKTVTLTATERRCLQLTRAVYLLRLITAQRGEEVLSMQWAHIADDWWTIPADVAKNGLAHRVPLTPLAVAELARLRDAGLLGDDRLFVGIQGTRQRQGALDGLDVDDVQPKDFRRTAASKMASAGVDRFVIKRILNHVDPGITAVYDRHSYDAQKRAGLLVWDAVLRQLIEVNEGRTTVTAPSG